MDDTQPLISQDAAPPHPAHHPASSAITSHPLPSTSLTLTSSAANKQRTNELSSHMSSTPLLQLSGHTAAITTVKYTDDGLYLVSAGNDNTVFLWNVHSLYSNIGVLGGHHSQPITDVAFNNTSEYLFTSSIDNTS